MTNKTKPVEKSLELELRLMLNDFFQDVDNECEIDHVTANAIVSIHLNKFTNKISSLLSQQSQQFVEMGEGLKDLEMGNIVIYQRELEKNPEKLYFYGRNQAIEDYQKRIKGENTK